MVKIKNRLLFFIWIIYFKSPLGLNLYIKQNFKWLLSSSKIIIITLFHYRTLLKRGLVWWEKVKIFSTFKGKQIQFMNQLLKTNLEIEKKKLWQQTSLFFIKLKGKRAVYTKTILHIVFKEFSLSSVIIRCKDHKQ